MVQVHAFQLRGEYDMANAADLEVALLTFARSNGARELTVDAEHLHFIDSSGIGALVRVRHSLAVDGYAMRVVNLPPTARRAVEILNLLEVLGVAKGS